MTCEAGQTQPGDQPCDDTARRFVILVCLLVAYSLIQTASRLGPLSTWLLVGVDLVVIFCANRIWRLMARGVDGTPARDALLSACGVLGGVSVLGTALIIRQEEHAVLLLLITTASSEAITSMRWLWGFQLTLMAPAAAIFLASATPLIGVLVVAVFSTALWSVVLQRNWLKKQEEARLEKERHQKAKEELRRKENWHLEREHLAVEAAADGHWYWDLKADRIHYSRSWAEMLGYTTPELSDNPEEWFTRLHSYYLPDLKDSLSAHIYGKSERFKSQYRIQHRDGSYLWVINRGLALRDSQGHPIAIAGSQVDITQVVDVEKSVVDEAFNDRLTGLPNRSAFLIRLERAVDHVKQERGRRVAVMFIDLDNFKVINDSLGHLAGDRLLAAVASRVRNCVRQGKGDLVARFGGDEFVILLEEMTSIEKVEEVANRVIRAFTDPFKIGRDEVRAGTSIGVALSDSHLERAEDLLRNADTAMYHAKSVGRGNVRFFTPEMHAKARRLHQLQNDLSSAITRDQLVIHYQPIFSFVDRAIVGAEALVRWRHSSGELVGPSEFIPIAEESGLIDSIGEWVLSEVCAQGAAWREAGLPVVQLSVNVSPRQLRDENFHGQVVRIIREANVKPESIQLELTETALLSDVDRVATTIAKLAEAGIGLALDDFGTGYSSLEHLRRFQFQTLKMDRSFVADLLTDRKSAAVATGLITLAHRLGLSVTAEGVESSQQLAFLHAEGCDRIQGYLVSRPVEAAIFEDLLKSGFELQHRIEVSEQQEPPSSEEFSADRDVVLVPR